jgi:hypothetical protein
MGDPIEYNRHELHADLPEVRPSSDELRMKSGQQQA